MTICYSDLHINHCFIFVVVHVSVETSLEINAGLLLWREKNYFCLNRSVNQNPFSFYMPLLLPIHHRCNYVVLPLVGLCRSELKKKKKRLL